MFQRLIKIVLLICGVLQSLGSPIYEDQLGESDWHIRNIGTDISQVLYQGSSIIVSTKGGVLASIHSRTGVQNWRLLLSHAETPEQIFASQSTLFTFSSRALGEHNSGGVLRAYSLQNGYLLWEKPLSRTSPIVVETSQSSLYPMGAEFIIDESMGQIRIVHNNIVYFFSLKGDFLWSWNASAGSKKDNKVLLLTQLLLPLTSTVAKGDQSKSKQIHSRVAVGCYVGELEGSDRSSVCAEVVVVTMDLKNRLLVNVEKFPGLPSLKFYRTAGTLSTDVALASNIAARRALNSITSTDPNIPYKLNDVIAHVSSSGVNVLQLSDRALDTKRFSGPLAGSARSGDVVSYLSFSLRTLDDDVVPAVALCRGESIDYDRVSTGSLSDCQLSVVNLAGSFSGGVFIDLFPTDAVAAESIRSLERSTISDRLFTSASLASVVRSGDKEGQRLLLSTATAYINSKSSSASPPFWSVGLIAGKPYLELKTSGLKLLSSRLLVDLKNPASVDVSAAHYIMSYTGLSFLEASKRVLWGQDEGLSNIVQAHVYDSYTSLKAGSSGSAFPDFSERISMQISNIQQVMSFSALSAAVSSLPSRIERFIVKALPPALTATFPMDDDSLHSRDRAAVVRDSAARRFGFKKLVVALTSSEPQDAVNEPSSRMLPIKLALLGSGLKVAGIETSNGMELWAVEPDLSTLEDYIREDIGSSSEIWASIVFAKLLPISRDKVSLVVTIVAVDAKSTSAMVPNAYTFYWHIPTVTEVHSVSNILERSQLLAPSGVIKDGPVVQSAVEHECKGVAEDVFILVGRAPGTLTAKSDYDRDTDKVSVVQLLFEGNVLESDGEDKGTMVVSYFPPNESPSQLCLSSKSTPFVYEFNSRTGIFQTHRVQETKGKSTKLESRYSFEEYRAFNSPAVLVGSVQFPLDSEEVQLLVRPQIDMEKRAEVLGDDSVLLRYLNPNLVTVISTSIASDADSVSPSAHGSGVFHGNSSGIVVGGEGEESFFSQVYVTLLDGVSGKLLHRMILEDASAPVHCTVVDNAIVTAYWNAKAKRTELSSVSLYEGLIDKYGLGPFAKAQPQAASVSTFSSFNTQNPIALQKTYIAPKGVTAMHVTRTKEGITNRNLLLALRGGQVFSLDRRQISPRRPLAAPTTSEAEEGLVQYNPYLFLSPFGYLSLNYTVASVRGIVSAPSLLESTSLVFSYGLDIHFSRDMPSQGFDMLSSDFNHPMLITILLGLGAAVFVLRKMSKEKTLGDVWA